MHEPIQSLRRQHKEATSPIRIAKAFGCVAFLLAVSAVILALAA